MSSRDAHPDPANDLQNRIAAAETSLLQFAERHPELHCLLLIDPAKRDPQAEWAEIHPGIIQRRLPIGLHESLFPPHHRPCLYALDFTDDADRAVAGSSLRMAFADWQPDAALQGLGHRICGWLWLPAEADLTQLAAHFGRQVVQYDLERNGRILLRYFDPRVLDLLWSAFSPAQREAVLGPTQCWQFVDRGQTLRSLTHPGENPGSADERLALNATQWQLVRRVGLINQTLARWQGMHPQPISASLPADVDDAVRQATLYGLRDEQDLIEFAWLAISVQPRFAEHPAFQSVFAAVRAGESFVSALSSLTPEHWQRIAAGSAAS